MPIHVHEIFQMDVFQQIENPTSCLTLCVIAFRSPCPWTAEIILKFLSVTYSPIKKCKGFSLYFFTTVPIKNLLPNKSGDIKVPYFAIPISYGLNSTQSAKQETKWCLVSKLNLNRNRMKIHKWVKPPSKQRDFS